LWFFVRAGDIYIRVCCYRRIIRGNLLAACKIFKVKDKLIDLAHYLRIASSVNGVNSGFLQETGGALRWQFYPLFF